MRPFALKLKIRRYFAPKAIAEAPIASVEAKAAVHYDTLQSCAYSRTSLPQYTLGSYNREGFVAARCWEAKWRRYNVSF